MDTEIELKMLLPEGLSDDHLEQKLASLPCTVEKSVFSLFNQYFDTPENTLSRFGIGLRVRSSDRGMEQTVKLPGSSAGGLHQRPEYNLPIDQIEPDLEQFDADIWPEGLNVSAVNEQLVAMFNTDFTRTAFHLSFEDGTEIELVHDCGEISAQGHSTPIDELELELKKGSAESLFDLAHQLCELKATQLGNLSKAARGFMLAQNRLSPSHHPLMYVKVEGQDSLGDGFEKALSYSLQVWQEAEYRYMQYQKVGDLRDVYQGIRLCLEALDMYADAFEIAEIAQLQKRLKAWLKKWLWIEQVSSMKSLRSKRGPYSKRLLQNDALMSYLRGLQDGILNFSRPKWLMTHKDNIQLQLALLRLLVAKPWREQNSAQRSIGEFAAEVLQQSWRPVTEGITASVMSADSYISQGPSLRKALFRGLFVGNLFSASRRDPFRAPWLDILDGISELGTLKTLSDKLRDSDVEDKSDLLAWGETKRNNLLAVMEQSKVIALSMEPYW